MDIDNRHMTFFVESINLFRDKIERKYGALIPFEKYSYDEKGLHVEMEYYFPSEITHVKARVNKSHKLSALFENNSLSFEICSHPEYAMN